MPRSPAVRISLVFAGIALALLSVADLTVTTLHPWRELGRLLVGFVTPDFLAVDGLLVALLKTVAFAFCGVALGSTVGLGLALVFRYRLTRVCSASVRAIHELFWALILMQVFGLHPLTGVLAIAIPFAGIFAKVYAEILEEADRTPLQAVPHGASHTSGFFYARLPDAWVHIKTYTLYRLECGLRSSAVLGFIGLPTLGFHLETAFMEGHYSEAGALLILFYVLIATMRIWVRTRLVPVYLLGALFVLGSSTGTGISMANVVRFFTQDIVPFPLRDGGSLEALAGWVWELTANQALPGIVETLVLTQIALVATGLLGLALFPLISQKFFGRSGRTIGHVFLVIARSTPEYILAYILLQLWGPSMLPAVVALTLHNGAIIGHLIGRQSDEIKLRPDSPGGLNLYSYEMVPRLYGQFAAFLFYRWEIILRETAILGILGIHTLGFYVDSAIQDLRIDRAMFLILVTAGLNIAVDNLSRRLRSSLAQQSKPVVFASPEGRTA